jgi:hypothetical protein
MKDGKLVVYGDVGQTFMYGAKGGSAFIMGNAAGRPLINAVGKPRVVINGTALDYLAESFMAGDALNGGGFVILNGIGFDDNDGALSELNRLIPGPISFPWRPAARFMCATRTGNWWKNSSTAASSPK